MSEEELHDSCSQPDRPAAANRRTVSGDAEAWGFQFVHRIEQEYDRRASELSDHASESDFRRCMVSSAFAVLINEGLSWDELVEVLSSTGQRDDLDAYQTNEHRRSTDQIDRLYEELAELNSQRAERAEDDELRSRIGKCLRRLRELQENEAAAIETHFSRTLSLPIGESERVLREARELGRKYANTSRADDASQEADD